jgi:hypothetical protein
VTRSVLNEKRPYRPINPVTLVSGLALCPCADAAERPQEKLYIILIGEVREFTLDCVESTAIVSVKLKVKEFIIEDTDYLLTSGMLLRMP